MELAPEICTRNTLDNILISTLISVCSDGRVLKNEDILKRFNNENCQFLRGKPKFFVFQVGEFLGSEILYNSVYYFVRLSVCMSVLKSEYSC